MKLNRTTSVFLVLPVLIIGMAGFLPSSTGNDNFGNITRKVATELPREHLSRRTLDETVSRQMFEGYLSTLDPDRVYFMAKDIDAFKRKQDTLHLDLKEGDLTFAFEVFETFRTRMRDRVAYLETLLADGFDLTTDETFHWQRREADWAQDETAWNELWRKRIKNEYLRRVVADALKAEEVVQEDTPDVPEPGSGPPPLNEDTVTGTHTTCTTDEEDSTAGQHNRQTDDATDPDYPMAAEDAAAIALQESLDALAPEEFIINRYVQHLHIMEDSDEDWVVQQYLSAFARAFDPHCDYMSPAASEDFAIEMKLSLVGIGAMLRPEDGTAKIVSLIPGGPAATDTREIRLRPGDKIIAVAQDDEPTVSIMHWPLYRSVRLIRGEKGTRVVLTVIPASDPTGATTKTVDLIRDEVKLEAREAKSTVETITDAQGRLRTIGVITLPTFYADMMGKRASPDYKSSARDVATILREMRRQNVDGVILDLRSNGGGSLIESVLMTGLFIETGPVVLVRERHTINILPDNDPTIAYNGPLVVLVNRISASASEIVAAALQDYGRAIVIGDSKTHGKGSVQTITKLGRNDALGSIKVTNALFYRISGGSTQLRGVEPDIVIPSAFDLMDVGEDSLPNPLEWSTVRPAMYSPYDDLTGTVEILRKRTERRQAEDERFLAYRRLLDRIEAMHDTEEISLNLETRKARSRTEKELLDIQNRLMDQTATEDDDAPPDIVKEESMRIMADWVQLLDPLPPPEQAPLARGESRGEAKADRETGHGNPGHDNE